MVERIIVVEDEEDILELAVRVLRSAGFHAEGAHRLDEARRLFGAATVPFDMLIVDVVLPDGLGLQLVDELLAWQPDLKVIFMTAYLDERAHRDIIIEQGHRLLQKPFDIMQLVNLAQSE